MAFSIKTQSKIAKAYKQFIKDFDNYFEKIEEIANKEIITKSDKIKIKMMLEILIEEYKNLKPSILIPSSLKEEAKKRYKKAKALYERLFKKRDS